MKVLSPMGAVMTSAMKTETLDPQEGTVRLGDKHLKSLNPFPVLEEEAGSLDGLKWEHFRTAPGTAIPPSVRIRPSQTKDRKHHMGKLFFIQDSTQSRHGGTFP